MRVDSGLPRVYGHKRQGERGKKLIEEGDADANYAYYALHKLHILPSVWCGMDQNEQAFVIAAIQTKIEAEKEERKKAERKAKKGR